MCGEYGSDSWRPHYHAILFGYDFPDKKQIEIKDCQNATYLSAELRSLWSFGNHLIAPATFETAAYVARYITKKRTGEEAEDYYTRDIIDFNEVTGEMYSFIEQAKLEPEYSTMSRGRDGSRGIGYEWYQQFKEDCYPSNYLIKDGSKIPIPKYYDKLLGEEDEKTLEKMKEMRKLAAEEDWLENTPERLKAREYCKIKQTESLARNKI